MDASDPEEGQFEYLMLNLLQTLQLFAQYAFPRALQAFPSENCEIRLRQWLGYRSLHSGEETEIEKLLQINPTEDKLCFGKRICTTHSSEHNK